MSRTEQPHRASRTTPRTRFALARLAPFRNAYILRGVLTWVGLRIALAFGEVSDPGLPIEVLVICLVGIVVVLDARRRAEDLFLANLGIPTWSIALMALPGALALEMLVP